MKIVVVGLGYVGTASAILLAQRHEVIALDICQTKVDKINARQSPVADNLITSFLAHKHLTLRATVNPEEAYQDASFIIIATPTNFNPETNYFDTHSVKQTITEAVRINPQATIIIKSTVPVGFTDSMRNLFKTQKIIFSPEFLREGQALHDNLYPSRIIIGDNTEQAHLFAQLLKDSSLNTETPVLFTKNAEAEAVKLFSNTFLAMRVAYFNELDTYAIQHDLDTRQIIEGVGLDPRIGLHYNNPSFGYGGYCLPKDTKQLLANYKDVPQNLIKAVVDANETRKDFIADDILKRQPRVIGVYRLMMKAGSDNFRSSSIKGIIERLKNSNIPIIIFEPNLKEAQFSGLPVINELPQFKQQAELIIANRVTTDLSDVLHKVYTRDLFGGDT